MAPKIRICPLKRLYWTLGQMSEKELEETAAVISTSGEVPAPSQMRGIGYVCRQYRDVDVESPGSFSDGDAAVIADFVRGLDRQIDTLFVCCDAAVSRSPGAGAAIARYYGLDDTALVWSKPAYAPNMLVFRKLAQALEVPVDDLECDRLFYENREAFRNAVAVSRQAHTEPENSEKI